MRALTLIFLFISFTVLGQLGLNPRFDTIDTKLIKDVLVNYDSLISYSSDCGTASRQYAILGLKGGNWRLLRLEVQFVENTNYKVTKGSKSSGVAVGSDQMRLLRDYLKGNRFWQIKIDSLNKDYYFDKRGNKVWTPIADGCSERFAFVNRDSYKELIAHNADIYQQTYFTADRDRFIKCREYFTKMFVR
jgi:hypothetical protein